MNKEEIIRDLLAKLLNGDIELVDLKVTEGKVMVYVDSIEGITIDQCGDISRALGEEIELLDVFSDKYLLEVSSPGLDVPMVHEIQFQKAIDKDVNILLITGENVKGKLDSFTDSHMYIYEIVQKGNSKAKKYNKELTTIAKDEISKAVVLVSFN